MDIHVLSGTLKSNKSEIFINNEFRSFRYLLHILDNGFFNKTSKMAPSSSHRYNYVITRNFFLVFDLFLGTTK
jgi:hypothetical protein